MLDVVDRGARAVRGPDGQRRIAVGWRHRLGRTAGPAAFRAISQAGPNTTLIQLSPPLGSNGAVKALAAGRIDLAVVGRALHPEEAARVGEHFVLAETAFVLASRDGRQDRGFSLDQLAAVYQGQQQTWQDGSPIRLILRASFESDSALLRSMSPAMARSVAAAASDRAW